MCIPFPEPWEFENDLPFTFYLLRLQTPPYDDTQGRTDIKTRENHGKELYNVWMHFSLTCCQKCERQCSKTIARHNSIFLRQKIWYSLFDRPESGSVRAKNIWPVIMTGDLLSVIFSPGVGEKNRSVIVKSGVYLMEKKLNGIKWYNFRLIRGTSTCEKSEKAVTSRWYPRSRAPKTVERCRSVKLAFAPLI